MKIIDTFFDREKYKKAKEELRKAKEEFKKEWLVAKKKIKKEWLVTKKEIKKELLRNPSTRFSRFEKILFKIMLLLILTYFFKLFGLILGIVLIYLFRKKSGKNQ